MPYISAPLLCKTPKIALPLVASIERCHFDASSKKMIGNTLTQRFHSRGIADTRKQKRIASREHGSVMAAEPIATGVDQIHQVGWSGSKNWG